MSRRMRSAAARLRLMSEMLGFLWRRKLWWMIPMVTVLLLFGLLIVLAQSTVVGPFIYTLF
ncbi:MAG TPA: hypothetical protein EYP04_00470 [Anaerolineae bacterium]|nr:hypothetical protein [Anaerolineae bacterium]HIQ04539.1 hypothetical protein [Anaerolineae bacterium]